MRRRRSKGEWREVAQAETLRAGWMRGTLRFKAAETLEKQWKEKKEGETKRDSRQKKKQPKKHTVRIMSVGVALHLYKPAAYPALLFLPKRQRQDRCCYICSLYNSWCSSAVKRTFSKTVLLCLCSTLDTLVVVLLFPAVFHPCGWDTACVDYSCVQHITVSSPGTGTDFFSQRWWKRTHVLQKPQHRLCSVRGSIVGWEIPGAMR